jgi:serine/threonine-protein kinase
MGTRIGQVRRGTLPTRVIFSVPFVFGIVCMTKARDFLGPYRLARLIRVGSSCQVWEAVDDTNQERYALKVLRADRRDDKASVTTLKFEYEVASSMSNNPRVIKVFDYRVESNTPFLVMELFSELNLKQALRRGADQIAFLLERIIAQAAEGLFFMHTKGWIHRDVKPDNFLVGRDGETKLIDFTIAQKKRTGLAKLFGSKVVQGTRSYMSPEQIRGQVLDERADVYSFGCTVFEASTGKPPFTGSTPNDLLNKHLHAQVPSPLVNNDNLTPEFADLVKRMMAKNREDRPSSMLDFRNEFQAIKMFKRPPRVPEVLVFDDAPSFKSPDQLTQKNQPIRDPGDDDDGSRKNKNKV